MHGLNPLCLLLCINDMPTCCNVLGVLKMLALIHISHVKKSNTRRIRIDNC